MRGQRFGGKGFKAVLIALLLMSSSAIGVSAAESGSKKAVSELAGSWMEPAGIWAAGDGGLIVIDTANHTIEKLASDMQQSWMTGGQLGVDRYGQPIGGYVDTGLEKSMFFHPRDIAVDSKGIIYLSDFSNHTIRKIVDGVVYTHAGTGQQGYLDGEKTKAQFNHPSGIAIDAQDNLYVADTMNHVIRLVTPAGEVSTVAGKQDSSGGLLNGSAGIARFNEPADVAIGNNGSIYVSDSGNQLIREIADNKVSTFAGTVTPADELTEYREGGYRNGARQQAAFNFPKGLHYENGILFIADSLNHRIRAITAEGLVVNVAGQGLPGDQLGAIGEAQFNVPAAVAYAEGKLYVSDSHNGKIKAVAVDLEQLETVKTEADIIDSIPLEQSPKQTQVWFDYDRISFTDSVIPYESKGKQFVPVRDLFEQWQADVLWHKETFEVEIVKNDWSVRFKLGEENAPIINGKGYVELAYLQRISQLRTIEVKEQNAIILMRD